MLNKNSENVKHFLIPMEKEFQFQKSGGCIPNCHIAGLLVGGGDTAHGGLPRLVSPPTGDKKFKAEDVWV
jgi:hypothetical protein